MSSSSTIVINTTVEKICDVLSIQRNAEEDSYTVKYAYHVPMSSNTPQFRYISRFSNLTDVYDYLTTLSEFVNIDIRRPDSIEVQFTGFPNIMIKGANFSKESSFLCDALKRALRFHAI